MTEPTTPNELPAKDRLMARPDEQPLPAAQNPEERGFPNDPKLPPPGGQGTDPKARDIDYTV